eukprot:6957576-Pyramimonas_sp.AAC.1
MAEQQSRADQSLRAATAELSRAQRRAAETAEKASTAAAESDRLGEELARTVQNRDQLQSQVAEMESQQAATKA